jgi:hypothetical protein
MKVPDEIKKMVVSEVRLYLSLKSLRSGQKVRTTLPKGGFQVSDYPTQYKKGAPLE